MLDSRRTDFTVETFTGWRVWAVTVPRPWEDTAGPVLRGAWGRPWPSPELEAKCLRPPVAGGSFAALLNEREKGEHSDPVPHPPCSCGIYARRSDGSDDLWVTRIAHMPHAGGFIEMSGRVIEGSKGYRAQWARIVGPLEVWVPCAECGHDAATVATRDRSFRGSCGEHAESGEPVTDVEDWMASIVPSLGRRYRVPIIEERERN